MKRFIYIVSLCLCLFLTACNDMTYLSTIVIKNNSRHTYYYKISCSETYYQDGGTLQSGSTVKTKVQSEHAYVVETFEPISLQLHSSKVVNARSDKTYTITINN